MTTSNPPRRQRVQGPRTPVLRPRLLTISFACLVLAGCPAEGEEVQPPSDRLFFPTGMALSPDEGIAFVANANSDLRFDSGSISVLDLAEVDSLFDAWVDTGQVPAGRDCEVDSDIAYTLVCGEAEVVLAGAGVRLGNFATEVAVQELETGALRLFAAVRGDPSLTYADWDAAGRTLSCGGSGSGFPACDDAHRLTRLREDSGLGSIPDEPFGLYVDGANGYVLITHLTQGAVSLADAPTDGRPPQLVDALGGVFRPNPNTGAQGAVGAAGRRPGDPSDRVYVTSRSESRVQIFTVPRVGGLPVLVPAEFFFLANVRPSDDARGIAFRDDGRRAYVVNRNPPMLHVLDTSEDEHGVPINRLRAAIELCPRAANLAVADLGRGERVYVACFQNGQIWVVDPEGAEVESIIDVGRGPQTIVVAEGRRKLYVTNFLEDTIAVVDLEPGSVTENRVVLRLGRARQSEDN